MNYNLTTGQMEIIYAQSSSFNNTFDATGTTLPVYVYGGSGNDTIIGGNLNDVLSGGGGSDSLTGNAGNDSLDGGTGADTLDGGLGADTLTFDNFDTRVIGGADVDRAFISGATAGVNYNLTTGQLEIIYSQNSILNNTFDATGAAFPVYIYGGSGNDTIIGGNLNDVLSGGAGNDLIIGNVGNDSLDGGIGTDTLMGGSGSDSLSGNAIGIDDQTRDCLFYGSGGEPRTLVGLDLAPSNAPTVSIILSAGLNTLAVVGSTVGTVTINDADTPLGDRLTTTLASTTQGLFELVGDQIRTLRPLTAADIGGHSASVVVSDEQGLSVTQTFVVTVTQGNTAPITTDAVVSTNEGHPLAFGASNFVFDDAEAGDSLRAVRIIALPTEGVLALDGVPVVINQQIPVADIGKLRFTPNAYEFGESYATFGFQVSDGIDFSGIATMTINVNALEEAQRIRIVRDIVLSLPSPDVSSPSATNVGRLLALSEAKEVLAVNIGILDHASEVTTGISSQANSSYITSLAGNVLLEIQSIKAGTKTAFAVTQNEFLSVQDAVLHPSDHTQWPELAGVTLSVGMLTDNIAHADLSPDNSILYTSAGGTVSLRDTITSDVKSTFVLAGSSSLRGIGATSDGKLWTADNNGVVRLSDPSAGVGLETLWQWNSDLESEAEVHSLLGNLQTQFFHQQVDTRTNQYAAELIGRTKQYFFNMNSNRGPSDLGSVLMGGRTDTGSSAGMSESFEFEVQPSEFTRLRQGGPPHWLVDAIVVRGGKPFAATGRPWMPITIRQTL